MHAYSRSPGEPELEDVVVSPALDGLVARVVLRVVVLVRLEQVARTQTVALLQETLLCNRTVLTSPLNILVLLMAIYD